MEAGELERRFAARLETSLREVALSGAWQPGLVLLLSIFLLFHLILTFNFALVDLYLIEDLQVPKSQVGRGLRRRGRQLVRRAPDHGDGDGDGDGDGEKPPGP